MNANPSFINGASNQPPDVSRLGCKHCGAGLSRTLTRVVDTLKVYPASRGTPKEESMTTTSTLSTEPTSSEIGVYSRPLPICGVTEVSREIRRAEKQHAASWR